MSAYKWLKTFIAHSQGSVIYNKLKVNSFVNASVGSLQREYADTALGVGNNEDSHPPTRIQSADIKSEREKGSR